MTDDSINKDNDKGTLEKSKVLFYNVYEHKTSCLVLDKHTSPILLTGGGEHDIFGSVRNNFVTIYIGG